MTEEGRTKCETDPTSDRSTPAALGGHARAGSGSFFLMAFRKQSGFASSGGVSSPLTDCPLQFNPVQLRCLALSESPALQKASGTHYSFM